MHARCCQTKPGRLKTSKELGVRTSGGSNQDDDDQGSDMPSWMFKEESNSPIERKKKPAQPKKNVDLVTQDFKVQEGTTEEKSVAGPVLRGLRQRRGIK